MVNRASSMYLRRTVGFQALLLAAGVWLLTAPAAGAAILDVAPGEVVVADNGLCSLREAFNNAETDTQADNLDCLAGSGADVIELAAGSTYTLPDEVPAASGSGLRTVFTEITVDGNGSTIERDGSLTCVIDGSHVVDQEFRILSLGLSADVTLNDLTLRNGCADGPGGSDDGGAIALVNGTLVLDRVTITDNHAEDKSGGLDVGGTSTVTIVDSTFTLNSSGGGGGAIGNGLALSVMTIEGSTIADNTAAGQGGGGIGNFGTLTILHSTISGNSDIGTTGGGGGIGSTGTVELVHSTLSGNSSTGPLGGGGIGNAGTIAVKNSIVAGSTAGGDCVNFFGSFAAAGANFDTDGTCAALDADFTQVTPVELALGPLADNGGPTETHELLPGSVAIDAATDCTLLDDATPVTEDQRDVARPQGPSCDAGSFELAVVVLPPSIAKEFSPDVIAIGDEPALVITITNPNAGTALTGVAFTDSLPAGLQVGGFLGFALSGCGTPTFAPVDGDTSLAFSDGTIAAGGTCTVTVGLEATTSGTKVNTTGNVSSTEGGTGNTATATLTVLAQPILGKSFAPSVIAVGGVSTLTFTIENPNSTAIGDVSGEDDFPAGLEVAATPNATTIGCGAMDFDAAPGDDTVNFSGGTIGAFGTCTASVDVTATTSGDKANSAIASSDAGDSNDATAILTVGAVVGVLEIPSLSQWGLLLLALALAGAAVWRLRLGC